MASPQWWPMDYIEVTGAWGNSPDFYRQFGQAGHNGIDLGTKRAPGMAVHSVDDGVIEFEGWGQHHSWMGSIAGICVIVRHSWGYSGYAHLSNTVVNRGQAVSRGQLLGASGATGVGTGPHLHFETFPPNPNFSNGFAGRVNPASIINLQPRGTTGGGSAPKPTTGGRLPMFDVYWTGPTPAKSKISGRLITAYGSFGIPNMQIYNLLERRKNAALKPGATDNMLDAEHAIIDSFLTACFHSKLTGVKLDEAKFLKAINDGFAKLGKNVKVTVDSVDVSPDDLVKALEVALPRVTLAMSKAAGK